MNYPQNVISFWYFYVVLPSIDGFVQERCNSIANTLDLRFSSTNQSICTIHFLFVSYFELDIVEQVVVLLNHILSVGLKYDLWCMRVNWNYSLLRQ